MTHDTPKCFCRAIQYVSFMSRNLISPRLDLPPARVADFRHGANLFPFRFRAGQKKSQASPPQTRELEASLPPRQEAPVQTRARTDVRVRRRGSARGARRKNREVQIRQSQIKIQA